jgi:hypothetical protein
LTIQAYIDDSGVSGTDAVFVLAGFIGNAEKWAAFSEAWSQHLKQGPSIRYLKMNEAAKLRGEFRSWEPEERDRKLAGCVQIIKQFRPDKGIYFINDLIAWKQIVHKMKVKTLADPHFHGFNAIISGVCNEALDSGIDEEVEIIFDQHVIFGPRVSFWYPALKEMIELTNSERVERVKKILPPVPMFRDDRQFVPLQAADILAWLLRTTFRDRIPGLETAWRYPTPTGFEWLAEELLPSIPPSQYSTIWGHERIARIQELSIEMRNSQEMGEIIVKWQKRLGVTPE